MDNSLTAASEVDGSVWRAIAGAGVKIPAVNSYVYFFPQGHLAQFDDADNYDFTLPRPWISCQVRSVRFLSNSSSDQVFVRTVLQPLQPLGLRPNDGGYEVDDDQDVVSFSKILTRSDANNGGGFSVPRHCADAILPHLNYAEDPPVQTLVLRDTHNYAWEFRHIYRGTPRRHLLTTGWSRFVNAKHLVAGDAVVFIKRKSTDELFVGVRRAQSFDGADRAAALAAIEAGVRGNQFEVEYYPKVGVPNFVVKAEKVKEALRMSWNAGMRVRMAAETDDASRLTMIQGVIAAVVMPKSGAWCGSPWRMLQITWDDPETSENVKRVSPWQVEIISYGPLIPEPDFPLPKKLKALPDSAILLPNEEIMAGASSSTMLNYPPIFSSGIQGARLNPNGDQAVDELPRKSKEPEATTVSTVLSIGSSYSNNAMSPAASVQPGQSSSSFQLFGQIIQMPRPRDGGATPV